MTAAALRSQYAAETANGAGYIWDERVQILEEGKVKKSGGNKAVLALLLALALVLVGSVAFFLIISRDGGAEAGTAQSAAVKPGKKDDKKKDELPEREGVFDENGVQTGYYLFDYDEEGHLIKEEEFGKDDQSNRWWEYTYSADGSETETRFYWQGEYTLRWIDYYGEDGVRTEQRSYNTALEAAEEVIGKTDEAAALCAEVYYAQTEDAMKAEDYATALDYYRSAGDVKNAAAYTAVLDPLLDGFYFTAAEAVQANRDSMPTSTGGAFSRSRWASPRSLQMCWFRRR